MLDNLKVKIGPQFYLYSKDAINFVPKLLEEYESKKILIIHGKVSFSKVFNKLIFLNNEKYNFIFHRYSGECSYAESERIKQIIKKDNIDFIIGIGGGKLSDLTGYCAHITRKNFGLIPTLASNCAPWTPLSVMYKENGESEGKTEHYFRQAAFLITDPEIIIDSPVRYFIAGLADTLAKWYESELILEQDYVKEEPYIRLARKVTAICKNDILSNAEKAIKDMKNKNISFEFKALSEIVFAMAGMVGGLGDKYARNSAAHAIHDAISKYISNSHTYLHGEIVAYGIFYQLALENNWTEIDNLITFYKKLNLPISLANMGISINDDLVDQLSSFIYSKEKVHLLPIKITKEILSETIINLENYIERKHK